jgi:acetaldehyde dehydrogenase/alcohol dehydrogenase
MSRTTPHLRKIYVHDQARTSRETGCLSGSEVSLFTVITDDDGRKYPIDSYKLTLDIIICDSTLCDTLPGYLVANVGVDAITHAIEAYVSVAQNDLTKMQALEAL